MRSPFRAFTTVIAFGAVVTAGALTAAPVLAQEVTLTGQVRPRFEFRDPVAGGLDDFTSMRVRLGVDALIERGLSVFVQVQDVRIWGEESHPLFDFSADALDLHQGYLRYRGEEWGWLTTMVGRMETNLGGQRLLGAVDWTQQGQSFDGLRFDVEVGRTDWVFLAFAVSDDTAPGVASEEELYGAYGTVDEVGPGALDLFWLYDRISGAVESDEHFVGARYAFGGDVAGRVEGTYALGTRDGVDVRAFLVGGRVGSAIADGRLTGTLWYDYLSGDDPGTPDVEAFRTLYATNHKFYGFADLFLNIPVHTAGAGLQDLALKLLFRPTEVMQLNLDVHTFRAAKGGGLTDAHFGEEIDLTVRHRYSSHLSATFGLSHVLQGPGLAEIGRLSEDMTWIYVMLDAAF
ncbi:MAG: alginate export family protein [Gemmatimonadetes bacterium]|nr:alginate export family protein [Gemmatimonadota bacterium]